MSGVSNYARAQIKMAVFSRVPTLPANWYVCLVKSAPTSASTGATIVEPSTTTEYISYARVQIPNNATNWDQSTGGLNLLACTMPTSGGGASSPVSIPYVAITDSPTYGAGNLWFFGTLAQPFSVYSGYGPIFQPSDLAFDIL